MSKLQKMIVTVKDLEFFANDPRNRVALGKCDRNAYKVYKKYCTQGAQIYYGKADYFSEGRFVSRVEHYWNVLTRVDEKGEELRQTVDIYNFKTGTSDEYRNHIGERESFEDFKTFITTVLRLIRRANSPK